MSKGVILGGGLASFTKVNRRPDTAKNWLYRILIMEVAHLIWVLRCERRIAQADDPGDYHSHDTMRSKWY